MEARSIGRYYPMDKDGYVINPSNTAFIPDYARQEIELLKSDILKKYNGHIKAIYLRGSIVQGFHVKGYSDIDILLIVESDYYQRLISNDLKSKKELQIFDFGIYTMSNLKKQAVQMMLKCQSTCFYGEDVASGFEKFRPGVKMFYDLPYFKADLLNALGTLHDPDSLLNEVLCRKITKIVIRVCFELVMERENKYTRSLHCSIESFNKYYPNKAQEIKQCLNLHLNPTMKKEDTYAIAISFGNWLIHEIEKYYSANIFIL